MKDLILLAASVIYARIANMPGDAEARKMAVAEARALWMEVCNSENI